MEVINARRQVIGLAPDPISEMKDRLQWLVELTVAVVSDAQNSIRGAEHLEPGPRLGLAMQIN
jgi:hypothetical protein